MSKASNNSPDGTPEKKPRGKKEHAVTMTPDKIREFAALFRDPERQLIELAKEMEDAEVEEIQALVQGIHTSLERIDKLIFSQFRQKIEKAAFESGKKARKKFG